MKPHQRRKANAYPYYKLAIFDRQSFTFRDGKTAYATYEDAVEAATAPGKYRISVVTEDDRKDAFPFDVE